MSEITLPYKFKPRFYQIPFLNAWDNGKKRMFLVWHRRCLHEDTLIAMSNGSFKKIKDVLIGDSVLSYQDNKLVNKKVVNVFNNGVNKVSWYGNLLATENHEVLTRVDCRNSYKQLNEATHLVYAGELSFGNYHNPELAEILGLLLTDGYIKINQTPKFTNIDEDLLSRFEYLMSRQFPDIECKRYSKGKGFDITCATKVKTNYHPIRKYFETSNTLPDIVWTFDKESMLAFLSGVISGDGSISYKKTKTSHKYEALTGSMVIEAGISQELAVEYIKILLKFGIHSKLKKDPRGNNHRVYSYSLRELHGLSGIKIESKHKQERLDFVFNNVKKLNNIRRVKIEKNHNVINSRVFDLEIEDTANYIANGYIVHNSGKDKTVIANMAKKVMERVGTYYYALPTYSQARKVIWLGADKAGMKFIDHFPKEIVDSWNQQEMIIKFKNGSLLQLIGADNIDRIVGTNPIGVVFSEYSLMKPDVWNLISPILRENDGWAVFVMTPRGTNHAFDLMQDIKDNKSWFCQVLTVDDTKALSKESLEEARLEMPQDLFQQEYYCKFLDSGLGFFRRVDENVYKTEEYKPKENVFYQIGVDLAKYNDYTVISPFNLNDFHLLKQDSFNQMDYNLQKARIENAYLRYNNGRIVIDSTGCLVDNQKIFTARGLIPISEVKDGELVLTADNSYQKIKNITSKEEVTEVYSITPFYQIESIQTSFTHLFKTPGNYKKAGDLNVGDLLEIEMKMPDVKYDYKKEIFKFKPFKLYHPKNDLFKDMKFYNNPLFWRIVGYYFAEGYVRRSNGMKQLQFAFHINEDEYHKDIELFGELIGRKMSKRIRKDVQCAELSISCGWLVDWFATFGKAVTKKFPYWFDNLPDEFKIEIIKGYWRGDGDRTTFKRKGQNSNKSMFRICSASEDLIATMQRWMLHFGIISSLTISKRLPNNKYVLNISSAESKLFAELINEEKFDDKRILPSKGKKNGNFLYVPIKEIKTEKRLATLWEFETENHSCKVKGATLHNVGEPVFDDLNARGMNITPFRFNSSSRTDLLKNLQILLEQDKIKIPDDQVLIDELKSMTYELSEQGRTKITVPDGKHDDRIMSLALAVWDIPLTPIRVNRNMISSQAGGVKPFYDEWGY